MYDPSLIQCPAQPGHVTPLYDVPAEMCAVLRVTMKQYGREISTLR